MVIAFAHLLLLPVVLTFYLADLMDWAHDSMVFWGKAERSRPNRRPKIISGLVFYFSTVSAYMRLLVNCSYQTPQNWYSNPVMLFISSVLANIYLSHMKNGWKRPFKRWHIGISSSWIPTFQQLGLCSRSAVLGWVWSSRHTNGPGGISYF